MLQVPQWPAVWVYSKEGSDFTLSRKEAEVYTTLFTNSFSSLRNKLAVAPCYKLGPLVALGSVLSQDYCLEYPYINILLKFLAVDTENW